MNCPNDLLTRKLDFYIGNDQLRDHCLINDHAETILNVNFVQESLAYCNLFLQIFIKSFQYIFLFFLLY